MPIGVYPNKYRVIPSRKGCIPWNKGKPHSPETRKKLSQWQIGRKRGTPSNETRIKMSEAQKRIVKLGRHNFGLGDKTSEHEKIRKGVKYKIWRMSVFKRDNWTCTLCGKIGGELNADHIKQFAYYPELRFSIDNGRTLCVPCHKTTDTYRRKPINI